MSNDKLGKARSFRPRPTVERRLEDAEMLGLNVSELLNEVLELHLPNHLVKKVKEEKEAMKVRQARMNKLLADTAA